LGAAAGRVKGSTPEARQLNSYLDALKAKVLKMEREMVQEGEVISFEAFREKWFGVNERPRMLLEIFRNTTTRYLRLLVKNSLRLH
jgi:hypothetical protein